MKCKGCDKTDGSVYTPNPSKVRCTVTGEYRYPNSECNVYRPNNVKLAVGCIVCGESVVLEDFESPERPRVCDDCKDAIEYIKHKRLIERLEYEQINKKRR